MVHAFFSCLFTNLKPDSHLPIALFILKNFKPHLDYKMLLKLLKKMNMILLLENKLIRIRNLVFFIEPKIVCLSRNNNQVSIF